MPASTGGQNGKPEQTSDWQNQKWNNSSCLTEKKGKKDLFAIQNELKKKAYRDLTIGWSSSKNEFSAIE